MVDGKMHYDLTAEDFVAHQMRFVEDYGVGVVGGCCGTTPEYIRQLAEAVGRPSTPPSATSDFEHGRHLDLLGGELPRRRR